MTIVRLVEGEEEQPTLVILFPHAVPEKILEARLPALQRDLSKRFGLTDVRFFYGTRYRRNPATVVEPGSAPMLSLTIAPLVHGIEAFLSAAPGEMGRDALNVFVTLAVTEWLDRWTKRKKKKARKSPRKSKAKRRRHRQKAK